MRIRELREALGIKQKELAGALGIAANTLSQYESGKREPDLETTKRLAEYLGVSVDRLLSAVGGQEPAPVRERAITYDDFTYAMQKETAGLTAMDKQLLLSMAKQLKDARKKRDGEAE